MDSTDFSMGKGRSDTTGAMQRHVQGQTEHDATYRQYGETASCSAHIGQEGQENKPYPPDQRRQAA